MDALDPSRAEILKFKIKDNFWLQYLVEKRFSPSARYYAVLIPSSRVNRGYVFPVI